MSVWETCLRVYVCVCVYEKCSLDSSVTAAKEGEGVQIPIQQNTETADTHTDTHKPKYSDTHTLL